jgi:hypothetical protein
MKKKKNKLYNFLKTGILFFGISLLLWGCEKEEFIKTESKSEFKIVDKKFKEFLHKTKFVRALEEIKPSKTKQLAKSNEDLYNFTIDSTNVREINIGNQTSYTFLIKREKKDSTSFENIFIKIDSLNNTEAFLIKYLPKENVIFFKNHSSLNFKGNIQITKLNIKKLGFLSKVVCIPIATTYCSQLGTGDSETVYNGIHIANSDCTDHDYLFTVYGEVCFDDGSSGGGGGGQLLDFDYENDNQSGGGATDNGGVNLSPITEPSDALLIAKRIAGILGLNSTEREWLNDQNEVIILDFEKFLDENNGSNEAKNWIKGQIELEILTQDIPWKASTGTIANSKYTHTYFDGSRGYFKLEDGSIVVNSSSEQTLTASGNLRDKYNEFNPNDRYYYIKAPGEKWAEMLFNPDNLADGLANLFQLAGLELGKSIGRYVLPVEDIKILIDGKDFDGQVVSRWQAAGFILLTVIPGSKALKPVARIATNATRWTKVISKGTKSYRYTSEIVNGIVEFGTYNSTKFREVLGIANNTLKQAHHVLSRNLRTHEAIQKAARNKINPFHIDEFLNGIPVDTWRNQFNHNAYDTRVRNLLNNIPDSLSPEETYNRIINLIGRIKEVIKNNPNKHLNDLIF